MEAASRNPADRRTPRPVNVGEVNGRIFLNNASLGTYAGILETRERVYSRWGRSQFAAYWSVLLTLLRPSLASGHDNPGRDGHYATTHAVSVLRQ